MKSCAHAGDILWISFHDRADAIHNTVVRELPDAKEGNIANQYGDWSIQTSKESKPPAPRLEALFGTPFEPMLKYDVRSIPAKFVTLWVLGINTVDLFFVNWEPRTLSKVDVIHVNGVAIKNMAGVDSPVSWLTEVHHSLVKVMSKLNDAHINGHMSIYSKLEESKTYVNILKPI